MGDNTKIRVKSIYDKNFKLGVSIDDYTFQKKLTEKLDNYNSDFNQETINEIVLWKVNRYALIENETINKINSIVPQSTSLDEKLTREILTALLNTKGIQLAMASTILRFRNPNVYQIIDQRAYRILYKKELKITKTDIPSQITLYLEYLCELRKVEIKKGIPFDKSDRILYMEDKRINKDIPLKN